MRVDLNYINFQRVTDANITFRYDSIADTFSFRTPFNKSDIDLLRNLKPLAYETVRIFSDAGELLMTGIVLNIDLEWDANRHMLAVSGASRTSVLDDCPDINSALVSQITDSFLERVKSDPTGVINSEGLTQAYDAVKMGVDSSFDAKSVSTCYSNLTMKQFAEKVCNPYAIKVVVDDIVKEAMDTPYTQSTTEPRDSVAQILSDMAILKNIVMRSNAQGELVFTQILPESQPTFVFNIDDGGYISAKVSIKGQDMHSRIHVVGRTSVDDADPLGKVSYIDNYLVLMHRPTLVEQGKEVGALMDVSKASLAKELQNITFTFVTADWLLVDNGEVKVGDLVQFEWFFKPVVLVIREISLTQNAEGKRCTIQCVLREAITGEKIGLVFDI